MEKQYIIHNARLYSVTALYHHGVKGMKWGVRRNSYSNTSYQPRYANRLSNTRLSDIPTRYISRGSRYASDHDDSIILPPKEYGHVLHEIRTYDPNDIGDDGIHTHNVEDFTYTYRNRPGDIPVIIDKQPITSTIHDKRGGKK